MFNIIQTQHPIIVAINLASQKADHTISSNNHSILNLGENKGWQERTFGQQPKHLFKAGLQRRWWILKENTYTEICSKVTWQGELGRKFTNSEENWQGATGN